MFLDFMVFFPFESNFMFQDSFTEGKFRIDSVELARKRSFSDKCLSTRHIQSWLSLVSYQIQLIRDYSLMYQYFPIFAEL